MFYPNYRLNEPLSVNYSCRIKYDLNLVFLMVYFLMQDEKDKKIQELSAELRNKKRLCTTYQEQLSAFIKIVEEHSNQLSNKVQNVVSNLKEYETIDQDLFQHTRVFYSDHLQSICK